MLPPLACDRVSADCWGLRELAVTTVVKRRNVSSAGPAWAPRLAHARRPDYRFVPTRGHYGPLEVIEPRFSMLLGLDFRLLCVADLPILPTGKHRLAGRNPMSIIVRAIDVGFGNTKYVTSSTNGKVECAHFPSLAFYCHNDQATESMGGKRRTVQVPVDGLFYEVGPDVELAADRFRSWQLHDGYTETAEYRAFTAAALHFMKIDTVDLLVVGLPVAQFLAKRSALERR